MRLLLAVLLVVQTSVVWSRMCQKCYEWDCICVQTDELSQVDGVEVDSELDTLIEIVSELDAEPLQNTCTELERFVNWLLVLDRVLAESVSELLTDNDSMRREMEAMVQSTPWHVIVQILMIPVIQAQAGLTVQSGSS